MAAIAMPRATNGFIAIIALKAPCIIEPALTILLYISKALMIPLITFMATKAPAKAAKATFILSIASLLLLILPMKSAIFFVISANLLASEDIVFATFSTEVEFFTVDSSTPAKDFIRLPIISITEPNALFRLSHIAEN